MSDHNDRLDLLRAPVRAPGFSPNLSSIEVRAARAKTKKRFSAAIVSLAFLSVVGVALAGLSGLLRHHSAPVAGGSTEVGGSYSDYGVPVTYVPISGTLHTRQGARITQAPGIPAVSQRDAVSAASLRPRQIPRPDGERPVSVETAFVEWNGKPIWVIAKEMGNVCPHVFHSTPVCINYKIILIDATTGVRISAFGGGTPVPIPQLGMPPLPKLIEMYAGGTGRAAKQETTGPESTLRNAFAAAGVVFDDNSKSFEGVTVDAFARVEPNACFVDDTGQAGACGDSGSTTVFVAWNAGAFGAATSDGAGGCLYIRYGGNDSVHYGSGSECTGAAALKASADTWSQAGSPSG